MALIQIATCETILEKQMLLTMLADAEIKATSPDRSVSRKYTSTTIDLSLGGYSSFVDGFKIFVNEEDEDKAREVLREFIKKQEEVRTEEFRSSRNDFSRFELFAIFSVFLPLASHAFGGYFLFSAWQKKEIKWSLRFYFLMTVFLFTFLISLFLLSQTCLENIF